MRERERNVQRQSGYLRDPRVDDITAPDTEILNSLKSRPHRSRRSPGMSLRRVECSECHRQGTDSKNRQKRGGPRHTADTSLTQQ